MEIGEILYLIILILSGLSTTVFLYSLGEEIWRDMNRNDDDSEDSK
jgi:hypothetical protein